MITVFIYYLYIEFSSSHNYPSKPPLKIWGLMLKTGIKGQLNNINFKVVYDSGVTEVYKQILTKDSKRAGGK